MKQHFDLSHDLQSFDPSAAYSYSFPGIVLESIGPVRHEVNVPFHDSQVRGKAILIQTGWDERWGTDSYWEPGPVLSDAVIFRLVRSGVALVGVDFWVTLRAAETRIVLSGKIPIVENLRDLSPLPRLGFHFRTIPCRNPEGPVYAVHAFAELSR